MATFGFISDYECECIAIGDCRNDGKERVYVYHNNPGYTHLLIEYSYNCDWVEDIIYTCEWLDSYIIRSLAVGNAQNDGTNRLYFDQFDWGSTASLNELTYSNGTWKKEQIGTNTDASGIVWRNNIAIGPGRNDGLNRIYWCGKNGYLFEYAYNNNTWNKYTLGPVGQRNMDGVVVGKARNDGVNRVYAVNNDGNVFEFSYTDGDWVISDVASVFNEIFSNDKYITIGQGCSDGKQRIYIGIEFIETIYELGYDSGFWEMDSLCGGIGCNGLTLGCGRNDGLYRIYNAGQFGYLSEFTYSGNQWILSDSLNLDLSIHYLGVALGVGRGDNVNRVYGICNDGNVYEYTYLNTDVSDFDKKELPDNFTLRQNFPNPFNSSTSIRFSLSHACFVALKIYDLLGNEIVTIVNANKPAGIYEVEWDAQSLPTGIYLCCLKAGNHVATKKFVLQR